MLDLRTVSESSFRLSSVLARIDGGRNEGGEWDFLWNGAGNDGLSRHGVDSFRAVGRGGSQSGAWGCATPKGAGLPEKGYSRVVLTSFKLASGS